VDVEDTAVEDDDDDILMVSSGVNGVDERINIYVWRVVL
jgi:hypothetical protein